jgi:hypothetical protein
MREIPVDGGEILAAVVMSDPIRATTFEGGERNTRDGVALWELHVTVTVRDAGASVLLLRVPGERPGVGLGQLVTLAGLRGRVWEMGGRHGISWTATGVTPAGLPPAAAPAAKRGEHS